MTKYKILLNILDNIRDEAPPEFKSYKDSSTTDKLNQARSKAFIHLFLKVNCGITAFKDRHELICDEPYDGGIDGYFIDSEKKKILLIQSKFRTTENNFNSKSMTADDLIKMEISRVLKGHGADSSGNEFNHKIKALQTRWREISDQAKYDFIVIILGNLTNYSDEQIKRLIDDCNYVIFDFQKTYNELVFPLCAGTYYDPKEITITINLDQKDQSLLKQTVKTKYGSYPVRVIFVPTQEIGRILHKYKNSILRYNPRNYLSLSHNKVNKGIRKAIIANEFNDFSILNNGITMIADSFGLTERTGEVNVGQIIMTNPQIVNGGQTAYTLSKIFEEHKDALIETFKDKEVLLKVIVMKPPDLEFIEEISNSTNLQSRVEEADRRSNESIQLDLQSAIYDEYGLFYERKRGEFYNGIDGKYISKDLVVNRYDFLRAYQALKGEPRWARQRGSETLFKKEQFKKIIDDKDKFRRMVFAYLSLNHLYMCEANDEQDWGNGLRYGKMAIIAAMGCQDLGDLTAKGIESTIKQNIQQIKQRWADFERWARERTGKSLYLDRSGSFDFDNYYKGKTVDQDIRMFFSADRADRVRHRFFSCPKL